MPYFHHAFNILRKKAIHLHVYICMLCRVHSWFHFNSDWLLIRDVQYVWHSIEKCDLCAILSLISTKNGCTNLRLNILWKLSIIDTILKNLKSLFCDVLSLYLEFHFTSHWTLLKRSQQPNEQMIDRPV